SSGNHGRSPEQEFGGRLTVENRQQAFPTFTPSTRLATHLASQSQTKSRGRRVGGPLGGGKSGQPQLRTQIVSNPGEGPMVGSLLHTVSGATLGDQLTKSGAGPNLVVATAKKIERTLYLLHLD